MYLLRTPSTRHDDVAPPGPGPGPGPVAARPQRLAWLLGHERRQRLSIHRILVAAAMYATCLAAQWCAVRSGLSAEGPARLLGLFVVLGVAAFYIAVRSGWTAGRADPALAFPQMVFATLCLAAAYTNNPSTRGSMLTTVALAITFGAYTMPTRDIRRATVFAVVALGAAMAWKSKTDPAQYPAEVEAIHFLLTCTSLPAFAFIAGEVSSLRANASKQRKELRDALARVVEIASHDELTGLCNRRHLQRLLDARGDTGDVVAVAILDLDHFKSVNDRFGHAVGDEVLRVAARVLSTNFRAEDVVGRWGGEEFLVLLPGANGHQAIAAVDRVRGKLAEASLPGLSIMFSAGVAVHRRGENMAATVERADRALYVAKERGRNRTVLSPLVADVA